MLQVKNLKKVYKTKNGADVHALDGVSLQFPETGMVFLLGKSGSGKSTLLNVCGGLDTPTEGEILVKGRSSKDFTQSDFDSYRNTFIGFIFQEYNILNEFSVEDNIALALELQGKPKDKAAIAALLEQVDLDGLAKRKPNTLSGGQKQRIAIARALIKAPEIIMADEPTGALDSNTGKQVFETLKKLSRDKLIIVVSHDRDFAELYGDRIIELKDGKILSDVSKTELKQQPLTDNINAVGDVLCLKNGTELTEQDFDRIKTFLKNSPTDVIIVKDKTDVDNFKKVSRINDNGEKEVFCDTAPTAADKQYTKEESRFIRSKLPLKHAFRIGVSGLKTKPVRLFFTIILCTVAFAFFGLLSTLNFYNSESTFKQTLADADISIMQLEKNYKAQYKWYNFGKEEGDHETQYQTRFGQDELDKYSAELSPDAFGTVRSYANFNTRQNPSSYWNSNISAFATLPDGNRLRDRINGAYPQNENEMVITAYTAQMLQNCNAYDSDGNSLDLSTPEDIIGKRLTVNGNDYKITGIISIDEIPVEYEALKTDQNERSDLAEKFNGYLIDSTHLIVFVNEDRLKTLAAENKPYTEDVSNYTSAVIAGQTGGAYEFPEWSNIRYISESDFDNTNTYWLTSGKTTIADNETVVSSSSFGQVIRPYYDQIIKQLEGSEQYDQIEKIYQTLDLLSELESGGVYHHDEDKGEDKFIPLTDAQFKSKLQQLTTALERDKVDLKLGMRTFDDYNATPLGDTIELNIVGVYCHSDRDGMNKIVISDTVFDTVWQSHSQSIEYYSTVTTKYKQSADDIYDYIYLPYEYSEQTANTYWDIYSNDKALEDDSIVSVTGNFINKLRSIDGMVKELSTIFLYVGLVFAVFAVLLFSNFISVSISQKKREIGILRAVGARGTDVFKIFFSESFVIAVICLALSTTASIVACGFINRETVTELGASLFVFGIMSFAVLVAIAMVTAVIATFLPVFNAAKKKPVDSIRSL